MNINNKKIDKNFVETIYLLNKHNIKYWLCHGTLLGIIRDKELIPWDHDIDIALWKEENLKETITNFMIKNNYTLKEKYFIADDLLTFIKKDGGREIDINFYEKKEINNEEFAYIKWFIPKNILMRMIDALSSSSLYSGKGAWLINKLSYFEKIFEKLMKLLIRKNLFYKSVGYTQPFNLLKEFKTINFKDIEVLVPKLAEEYLAYVYGSGWKKPIKKFNWIKDSPSTRDV